MLIIILKLAINKHLIEISSSVFYLATYYFNETRIFAYFQHNGLWHTYFYKFCLVLTRFANPTYLQGPFFVDTVNQNRDHRKYRKNKSSKSFLRVEF